MEFQYHGIGPEKGIVHFICEIVTNNGENLLFSLSAEQWNAVILELILKYSRE